MHPLETLLRKFRLPKCRGNKDFIRYLQEDIYNNYLNDIALLKQNDAQWCLSHNRIYDESIFDQIQANYSIITKLCDNIIIVLNHYYDGFPDKAYELFSKTMDDKANTLWLNDFDLINDTFTGFENRFFRMRGVNRGIPVRKRSDMFHVPFDRRENVQSYRYSIAGFPSLYLGTSLEICWRELNLPKHVSVAEFKFTKEYDSEFKVLNFTREPLRLASEIRYIYSNRNSNINRHNEFIIKYLTSYPLLAACSIAVPDKNVNFKAEYIIPQLLLQWIRKGDSNFNGIAYFSCSLDDEVGKLQDNINIVIPIQTRMPVDYNIQYCESLANQIQVSDVHYISFVEDINFDTLCTKAIELKAIASNMQCEESQLSTDARSFLEDTYNICNMILKSCDGFFNVDGNRCDILSELLVSIQFVILLENNKYQILNSRISGLDTTMPEPIIEQLENVYSLIHTLYMEIFNVRGDIERKIIDLRSKLIDNPQFESIL